MSLSSFWLHRLLSCQRAEEQSQTFCFFCLRVNDCVDERDGSVFGCADAFSVCDFFFFFFSASVCPHACTEEGKPYLLEQHPHTPPPPPKPLYSPPPPHPSSSLSDTSSLSINRDRECLAVLLLASDLQASLFPESSSQTRKPMSSH